MLDEVATLAKDRRLYHLHAATFIIGFLGILAAVPMTRIVVDPRVAAWFGVGAAVVLTISGVLAVAVKRTMFAKSADQTEGMDFEDDPGDAVPRVGGLRWAWFENALAPQGLLLIGLVAVAIFVTWALLI